MIRNYHVCNTSITLSIPHPKCFLHYGVHSLHWQTFLCLHHAGISSILDQLFHCRPPNFETNCSLRACMMENFAPQWRKDTGDGESGDLHWFCLLSTGADLWAMLLGCEW